MKILVDGAGIAGLVVALHLQKQGHRVTVIEKASNWKQEGFVLGVWGSLTKLDDFGFRDRLKAIGFPSQCLTIRDEKGRIIRSFDYSDFNKKYGQVYIVERSDLHKKIHELIEDVHVHLATTITSIDERADLVDVNFDNGTSEEFDLVIGADGVHSQVRQLVFPEATIKYFGLQFWMCYTEVSYQPDDVTMIAHRGKFFGAYPSGEKKLFTIFALDAPSKPLPPNHHPLPLLRQQFFDFTWIVPEVLAKMSEKEEYFCDTTYEVRLKNWHTKRVVLIGDSAHGLVATASMGASMAFEDAYILAEEIGRIKTNGMSLQKVLQNYQKRKEGRMDHVRRATHFYGYLIRMSNPWLIDARDIFLKTVPESFFLRDIEYILDHEG